MPVRAHGEMYYMEQVPVNDNLRTGFLSKRFKLPRPVFPEGTLDEVLAVKDSTGPWYVVERGFRVGVYTTWVNGADLAVSGASTNSHSKVIDMHYEDVCSILMQALQNNVVCNIPYIVIQ
jgi:hypothetical protein